MNSRLPFFFLLFVLIAVGLGSIYYRYAQTGVPLTPGQRIDVWQVEAQIEFQGLGEPVTVTLNLPGDSQFELLEEFTASPAYGVNIARDEQQSKVVWSKREVTGPQTLYYKGSYKEALNPTSDIAPALVNNATPTLLIEPYASSAKAVLAQATSQSGNQETLVEQVVQLINSDNQNVAMLLSRYSRTRTFTLLMEQANIPVKSVRGLQLEDERRNQSLIPMVKVYADKEWRLLNLSRVVLDEENPLMIWLEEQPFLLDVVGGEDSSIRFAISKFRTSAVSEANKVARQNAWGFGLYSLPIAEQNLFRSILLLPIGALVVVFLRILVGVRCSGTFMPILIATAFIQTELLNGLLGFTLVVAAGLVIRSYLSHLNLLMVSRISAVVIVVIGIIIAFTVFAFRMGLTEALTITFFPMVIMAWTIERMSILWEEEGAREVLVQGMGSLFIAIVAYLLMDNQLVRHWAFNFLGVHVLIMAAILMMGQYTGYRLLELRRFKPLA